MSPELPIITALRDERIAARLRELGVDADCESAATHLTAEISMPAKQSWGVLKTLWAASSTLTLGIVPYWDDVSLVVNIKVGERTLASRSVDSERAVGLYTFFLKDDVPKSRVKDVELELGLRVLSEFLHSPEY